MENENLESYDESIESISNKKRSKNKLIVIGAILIALIGIVFFSTRQDSSIGNADCKRIYKQLSNSVSAMNTYSGTGVMDTYILSKKLLKYTNSLDDIAKQIPSPASELVSRMSETIYYYSLQGIAQEDTTATTQELISEIEELDVICPSLGID